MESSLVSVLGSQKGLGKFFGGEVSEFVHGDGEGLVSGIVLVDEVQVALEDSVSVEELIVVISLLVLLHPESEGGLVFGLSEGIGNSEEHSDGKNYFQHGWM
jgi:preprotein translocase subunit SecG